MKNNMKKIIFYISLIPYIILIFMCVYHAIFGYEYTHIESMVYGFEAIGEVLLDGWNFITIDVFCGPGGPLVVAWVGFQIYYFISFKSNKKETEEYSKESKESTSKKIDLKKILFNISKTCWIIYFASGIFAFFFGANTGGGLFNSTREYGIDALLGTLFWNLLVFSFIPILPISLLYIIIYLVVKKREEKI